MVAYQVQLLLKSTFLVIRYTFSAHADIFFDLTLIPALHSRNCLRIALFMKNDCRLNKNQRNPLMLLLHSRNCLRIGLFLKNDCRLNENQKDFLVSNLAAICK